MLSIYITDIRLQAQLIKLRDRHPASQQTCGLRASSQGELRRKIRHQSVDQLSGLSGNRHCHTQSSQFPPTLQS